MCHPLVYVLTLALSLAWGVGLTLLALWHFIAWTPRKVADV